MDLHFKNSRTQNDASCGVGGIFITGDNSTQWRRQQWRGVGGGRRAGKRSPKTQKFYGFLTNCSMYNFGVISGVIF